MTALAYLGLNNSLVRLGDAGDDGLDLSSPAFARVEGAMHHLAARGHARKCSDGRWRCTDTGRARARKLKPLVEDLTAGRASQWGETEVLVWHDRAPQTFEED